MMHYRCSCRAPRYAEEVERWTTRLASGVSSAANALLAAFAAIIAGATASWVAGAPASLLAALAASAVLGSLTVLTVRARVLSLSHQHLVRSYLNTPDLGPSRFLPVGPAAGGTPVGQILTRRNLLVRQRWHRLLHPSRSEDADFAIVAADEVAAGGRVMIVGEPGIGKSLTVSRIFQILAENHLSDERNAPVPVFIHLGDVKLADSCAIPAPDILDVAARHTRLERPEVDNLAHKGRLITVLDGLDEAAGIIGGASARAALASAGFGTGRVVTARRDFFDLYASMPEMAGRFTLTVELERLPFDEAISDFIDAYCDEFGRGDAGTISQVIQQSPELQDLTSRPLTLWMTVDVLTDPAIGKPDQLRTLTSLYNRYTEKWLQREALRPGAQVERADDKRALVRLAARAMFQRGTAWGGAGRTTTEMAASRDQLAEALGSDSAGRLVGDIVGRLGLHAALDELCLRTFLVRGSAEEGYRFAHKSFFEFFVALDMWECIGRESHLDVAEEYFARPLSDPVVYFFREMLAYSSRNTDQQRLIIQNMTALLTRRMTETDLRSETVRQHVGNLLTGIADVATSRFLAEYINQEPSEFVRRGITVGLALQQGRVDLITDYVERLRAGLRATDTVVSIQLGYSRIYHGDQDWTGRWEDDGSPEVSRTIHAQIDRLLSSRNREMSERIWPLTLFTLRALLKSGRGWLTIDADPDRKEQLISFLRTSQPGRGEIFEDERKCLLNLLAPEKSDGSSVG